MTTHARTVSHHMLRRTARVKAKRLNESLGLLGYHVYRVEKAERGPWRWRVVVDLGARLRAHDAPSPVAEPGGLS